MTNFGNQYHSNPDLIYKYTLVRETVSAEEVGKVLGLDIDRHGRCRCPFHNGTDRNMKVYTGNRGFYCFVCHKGGDCITLAKELLAEDCTYTDAAKWIDRTFQLNIFENKKPSVHERYRRSNLRTTRTGVKQI